MSSNLHGLAAESVDDDAVAHYLQQNSDFFERHPQLLARLRLHHPRNGATISLIERQVEVLRDKHQQQEQKLAEFVRVARSNNVLAEKIHRFTRRLLRTGTHAQAVEQIEASLREDFDTFHAVLVLPHESLPGYSELPQRFLRRVAGDDQTYRSFDTLFATCKPRCGQVRDSQREFLFGTEAPNIGSVALIPLGGQPPLGLLALGSVDLDRFHPGMSTEFLSRMSELITDALARP
ncbi:MAG TPA: DUF484 family protein [Steroidobacteraceae bacterium]|jgi:hypothetical protein|nr:DUF484 family protein [Steroidobacteraceae bacterium]